MTERTGWFGVMKVNNFHEQLKHSESSAGLTLVSGTINYLYPDHIFIEEITDLNYQARGLDRIIHFNTGELVGVEHKIRETKYHDILFEFVSNDYTNTLGWAEKDLSCDIFIYGWNPTQETYTFDWKCFKRIWEENKREWGAKYRRVMADNDWYYTHSIAVPIEEIIDNIPYFYYNGKNK